MSEDIGIGAKIALDMSEFGGSISKINQGMSLIKARFAEASTSLGAFASDSDRLSVRQQELVAKIEQQQKAVQLLQEAYEKASSGEEKDADQANILAKQLLNAQTSLNKMNSDLQKTSKELDSQPSRWSKLKGSIESATSGTSKLQSAFGSLKGTLAGMAMGAVAGFSIEEIVKDADSASKNLAQMSAVLKSTGDAAGMTQEELVGLAESQSKVTTYSAETTEAAENMLLTFTNIKGNVFPQTIKATEDMATAMHMDATSAAQTLGKALNDPASGLTRLTRVGVTFTDAQKKQITAMEKAGNTAGAQRIILQELEREFGNSAVAAGKTLPGQIQIMQNSLKSSGVTIETALMPIATETMPAITKGVQDIAQSVEQHKEQIAGAVKEISTLVTGVFQFAESHGPLVKGVLIAVAGGYTLIKGTVAAANAVSTIRNGLEAIGIVKSGAAAAATGAEAAATEGATAAQTGLNVAMLANPIGIIILAIGALVAAFIILWNNCKGFRDFWISAWNGIKTGFSDVVNFIRDDWKQLALFLIDPIAGALALLYKNNPQFRAWADNAGASIKQGFTDVVHFFENLPAEALQWGKDMIGGLVSGIKGAIGDVQGAVTGVADKIRSFLHFSVPDEGPLSDADTYGADMMQTMGENITANKGYVVDATAGVASDMENALSGDTVVESQTAGAAATTAQKSVSSTAAAAGNSDAPTVQETAEDTAVKDVTSSLNLLDTAVKTVTADESDADTATKNITNSITGADSALKSATDSVTTGVKSTMDDLDQIGNKIKSATSIIEQLGTAVTGAVSKIESVAAQATASIQEKAASVAKASSTAMASSKTAASKASAESSAKKTTSETRKTTQININGDVNVADKGSKNATLQQLQFLAVVN